MSNNVWPVVAGLAASPQCILNNISSCKDDHWPVSNLWPAVIIFTDTSSETVALRVPVGIASGSNDLCIKKDLCLIKHS